MELALELIDIEGDKTTHDSFNPCFNGTCFRTGPSLNHSQRDSAVSILVLMELALEHHSEDGSHPSKKVSILVLMELALELNSFFNVSYAIISFNPCFNGTCFRTCRQEYLT